MNVEALKTPRIGHKTHELNSLLDEFINELPERSIVAITSKIVSLCEGNTVKKDGVDLDELVRSQADLHLPESQKSHGINITIKNNILIPNAGIDESNADGRYVLWPEDPYASANNVREYLVERFNLSEVGVIITDSVCNPLCLGTTGIAIGYSGFKPVRDYRGKEDLFDRSFKVEVSDLLSGLAVAAVLVMGEGKESRPLAVLSELDFIEFTNSDPSVEEIAELRIPKEEDLFAPVLNSAKWVKKV